MGVGPVPDLAGSPAAGVAVHAHAAALDALAREHVRRPGRGQPAGGGQDDLAVDASRHVDDFVAVDDADPIGGDGHGVAGADRSQEAGGPAGEGATGLIGHCSLSHGRQPHAVDDRAAEPRDASSGQAGVNRVVVARNVGKRAEISGGLHLHAGAAPARRVVHLTVDAARQPPEASPARHRLGVRAGRTVRPRWRRWCRHRRR